MNKLLKGKALNILIVVVVVLLAAVFVVDLYLVFKSPAKDTLLAEFFPTPTLPLKEMITRAALTAQVNATPTPGPTITTMSFPTREGTATSTSELQLPTAAAPTPVPPTQAPTQPLPTPPPTATRQSTPAAAPAGAGAMSCIPTTQMQEGKVLDIVDGNTIKVMVDGLVYTVRYIGVAVPGTSTYAQAAAFENGKLVFLKDATLYSDQQDKDANGRLLRYVVVGDVFANNEMLSQGLGSAVDTPPNSSCAGTFSAAEQAARANQIGQWKSVP